MKEQKNFYVSNKLLFQTYLNWYRDIKESQIAGEEEPEIPPYIVESIMKICNKLSYRPNFIGYSYRHDLVSEAIFTCFKKAKKFNASKSDNPFSYFTTIAWNVFLQNIDIEKKQTYIRAKVINETPIDEFVSHLENDDDESYTTDFVDFVKENSVLENNEPMSVKRARKKSECKEVKRTVLDELMEETE